MTQSKLDQASKLVNSEALSHTRLADNTGVILDINGRQVLSLNESGMLLLDQIKASPCELDDLVKSLTDEYDISKDIAQADIDTFLSEIIDALGEK